jgi:hypothetical protein
MKIRSTIQSRRTEEDRDSLSKVLSQQMGETLGLLLLITSHHSPRAALLWPVNISEKP